MKDPTFRVNIRHIKVWNRRASRRFRRELREADPNAEIADLEEKINLIYQVAFGGAGQADLDHVRGWIEAKFDKVHWRTPMMRAMIYSGDFETYRAEAAARLVEMPDSLPAQVSLVRGELLVGNVAAATEVCKTHLKTVAVPPKVLPREIRFMAQHLVMVGEGDWLRQVQPKIAAHMWQFRYLKDFLPLPSPPVKTFCLNLDRDVSRLRRAEALLGPGVDFHRSPGVSGVAVPDCLLAQAGLEVAVKRKAQVGCHLSHIRAWERIRDEVDDGSYGLVAEDDACFTCGPGAGLSEALKCAREDGLDILFINEEASLFVKGPATTAGIKAVSVDHAYNAIGDNTLTGWGGEGYLLTPKGASLLIEFAMKFGIVGALDWQIALYAMADIKTERMRENLFGVAPERIVAARAAEPGKYFIKGGVLNMGLMRQNDLGYKIHNIEVSLDAGK